MGTVRRVAILGACLPMVVGLVACCLLRPEVRTLAAPLLGPWAGHLYGHRECTMASQMPGWSLASAVVGALALGILLLGRTPPWRTLAVLLLAVWSFAWSWLALLSVLNTCG
jgi:hypothetical protein